MQIKNFHSVLKIYTLSITFKDTLMSAREIYDYLVLFPLETN